MPLISANVIQKVFQPLISAFDAVIQFFHDSIGFGWGLSIIALTVLVRILLIPLTVRQFRSMQAMQALQPEIKKLQAKYKDDKQRLNQEMMKFYQENKVNPFGSCLPLLAQFPVFISLFYMLRKDLKQDICGTALAQHHITSQAAIQKTGCDSVDPGSAKFLFIHDLTHAASGGVLILLIVLYVGSQLGSSLIMSSAIQDKNQRYIMLALPFMFVLFVKSFPAGLLLYWITTNLWTVGQAYVQRRARERHAAKLEAIGGPELALHASGTPGDGEDPVRSGGFFASFMARAQEAGAARDDQASKGGGGTATKAKTRTTGANGSNGANGDSASTPSKPKAKSGPPPSARKKKKRSGRRR